MVTAAAVWAALADVKDPEIPPVSVVDMGMVSRVIVGDEAAERLGTGRASVGASPAGSGSGWAVAGAGSAGSDGGLDTAGAVQATESARQDQRHAGSVIVEMTPTFVGCPALGIIRQHVIDRLMLVDGVKAVAVHFVFDPPWTSDRITPEGRERLRSFGIAPPVGAATSGYGLAPGQGLLSLEEVPPCPFCGSDDTHMENLFGPTACRAIYYCDSCQQPFEAMKTV